MKKIIALLIAAVMVFAFASCGEEPAATSSEAASVEDIASVASVTPIVSQIAEVSIPVFSIPEIIPDDEPKNIALDATVTDCGVDVYPADENGGDHVAQNINDGNTGGPGWQPSNNGFEAGNWAELTFEETHTIDLIVIYCEDTTTPSFAEGGYTVAYTTDGESYENIAVDAAQIESAPNPAAEGHRIDTITLNEATEVTGVRIILNEKSDNKGGWAPHIFEIEIYEAQAEETGENTESVEDTVTDDAE